MSSKNKNLTKKPTFLPKDWMQMTTEFKFCLSQRSTLWNVSWVGTPNFWAHPKKAEMFSIHLKAILLSLIFLTEPASMQFTNLHRRTPSFNTSKKLSMSPEVLMGSPVISLIHSRHSCASSSLYFELIWKETSRKKKIRTRLFSVDELKKIVIRLCLYTWHVADG